MCNGANYRYYIEFKGVIIQMKTNAYNFVLTGERIRQARKARRYTQAEVAEMINMSSKNFSQLERGMTGISVSSLIALCKCLDVSSDYILFGTESAGSNSAVNILLSQLSETEKIYAEKLLEVYVNSCKNKK